MVRAYRSNGFVSVSGNLPATGEGEGAGTKVRGDSMRNGLEISRAALIEGLGGRIKVLRDRREEALGRGDLSEVGELSRCLDELYAEAGQTRKPAED